MDTFSQVTQQIGQKGRRGALMISIDCTHPDLEKFIKIKNDLSKVNFANISVRVTNDFMQAVIDDKDWELSFHRKETDESITKTVKAKDIFRLAAGCLSGGDGDCFVFGGDNPYSYQQVKRMCERIQRDTGFDDKVTPIRFRTTVLTDIYDQTKDVKAAQAAAGHTTSAMTLKHYVKGRSSASQTASAIDSIYAS